MLHLAGPNLLKYDWKCNYRSSKEAHFRVFSPPKFGRVIQQFFVLLRTMNQQFASLVSIRREFRGPKSIRIQLLKIDA